MVRRKHRTSPRQFIERECFCGQHPFGGARCRDCFLAIAAIAGVGRQAADEQRRVYMECVSEPRRRIQRHVDNLALDALQVLKREADLFRRSLLRQDSCARRDWPFPATIRDDVLITIATRLRHLLPKTLGFDSHK